MSPSAATPNPVSPVFDRSGELPGNLAAGALLAALAIATVAWGAVSPGAKAAWTATVCGLGCAGVAAMLFRGTRLLVVPGALPLVLFIAFAFFQVVPFGVTLSAAARDATGMAQSAAISWIPASTLSHGRHWLGLLVVFTIGALLFAHPRRMRQLPWTLLLLGCVVSSYYAFHPFLEHVPDHVAVDGEGAFSRHVFGTYLNRNHVAGFLVLAIVFGIGLFVTRQRTLCHRSSGFARRQFFIVAMILVSTAGLLTTHSRGGIVNLVVSILVLAVLLPRRAAGARHWTPLLAVVALVAVLPFALPPEFAARFLDISRDVTTEGSRRDLWQSAWTLFEMSPIVGHGLGTFGDIAVLGQPPQLVGHLEHAHSDPLEYLVETGLLGVNLLLWASVLIAVHVVRRCLRTRGDRRTILAAASIAVLTGMAVQSCVDFHTHIPALAGWAALVIGAASGAMASANGLPQSGSAAPRWLLPPVMVALGLAAVFAGRESWSYAVQHEIAVGGNTDSAIAALVDTTSIHPCKGEAFARAAWIAANIEEAPRDLRAIRSLATRAVAINPFDARAWRALALADIWAGDTIAGGSLQRAVRLTPPGDRTALRIELGIELLAADRAVLAKSWFADLFADKAIEPMLILRHLHAADALNLDLVPLIPEDGRASLRKFADSLLHNGEIRQREKILDLLLERSPMRDRLTIRDNATLVRRHVHETFDENGHRVHVELTIDVPLGYSFDSQMMCLNLRGEHAAVEHYFRPESGTSYHIIAIPASTPPGEYELALQAFTKGTRFPLSIVRVAETGLHLTPGRTMPAERALYRELTEPTALAKSAKGGTHAGLDLTGATRLWRRVRLSQPGGTLIITCATATPIRVRFNDTTLPRCNAADTDGRYRLPSRISSGRLEITLDDDSAAAAVPGRVLRLTLVAEPGR